MKKFLLFGTGYGSVTLSKINPLEDAYIDAQIVNFAITHIYEPQSYQSALQESLN